MSKRATDNGDNGGATERRLRALEQVFDRVRTLEERAIKDDGLHHSLEQADSQTASAVMALTRAVNDPKDGLIVELNNFRQEVRADRKEIKAGIRGAILVLGALFTGVTILAPWIQRLIEAIL